MRKFFSSKTVCDFIGSFLSGAIFATLIGAIFGDSLAAAAFGMRVIGTGLSGVIALTIGFGIANAINRACQMSTNNQEEDNESTENLGEK